MNSPVSNYLFMISSIDRRSPPERARSGEYINEYGDPRTGVIDFNFGRLDGDYWCKVPAGIYLTDSDDDDDDEKHEATISYDYWVAKYPVTYAQYKAFCDDPNGYSNPVWWNGLNEAGLKQQADGPGEQLWKMANHPAEHVSWYDAMAFCAWLNARLAPDSDLKSKDYSIRLPTGTEWEKAARGTDGREYPWGNDYQSGFANINETYAEVFADSPDESYEPVGPYFLGRIAAVGLYPQAASPYGVLDMIGNVWEWTLTLHRSGDNTDLMSSWSRLTHGGAWETPAYWSRAAVHNPEDAQDRSYNIGFRLIFGAPVS